MGRTSTRPPTPAEMLLAQITHADTGHPASYKEATQCWKSAYPASYGPGWYWIPATSGSADGIRRDGHLARGTEFIVWFPQQTGVVVAPTATPDDAHRAELGYDAETGLPRQPHTTTRSN